MVIFTNFAAKHWSSRDQVVIAHSAAPPLLTVIAGDEEDTVRILFEITDRTIDAVFANQVEIEKTKQNFMKKHSRHCHSKANITWT